MATRFATTEDAHKAIEEARAKGLIDDGRVQSARMLNDERLGRPPQEGYHAHVYQGRHMWTL